MISFSRYPSFLWLMIKIFLFPYAFLKDNSSGNRLGFMYYFPPFYLSEILLITLSIYANLLQAPLCGLGLVASKVQNCCLIFLQEQVSNYRSEP